MPEMHLKQLGFTYSACGPFTKNKERIKKFMQTIQIIFTKIIFIKLVFDMIWLMVSIFIIQRQYLGADLADMQLISKCNKGITSLLCVINLFSKYCSFKRQKRSYYS